MEPYIITTNKECYNRSTICHTSKNFEKVRYLDQGQPMTMGYITRFRTYSQEKGDTKKRKGTDNLPLSLHQNEAHSCP